MAKCYKLQTSNPIGRNDWTRFFAQFKSLFFTGGDFDAHNTEWDSRKFCRDGLAIDQICSLSDLVMLNDGSTTYHDGASNKDSSIDLTLVNEEDLHRFRWRVGTDSWGSGRFPIPIGFNATFKPNLQ